MITYLKIIVLSNNVKTFKIKYISTTLELLDINLLNIDNVFEMDSKVIKNIFDDFI